MANLPFHLLSLEVLDLSLTFLLPHICEQILPITFKMYLNIWPLPLVFTVATLVQAMFILHLRYLFLLLPLPASLFSSTRVTYKQKSDHIMCLHWFLIFSRVKIRVSTKFLHNIPHSTFLL